MECSNGFTLARFTGIHLAMGIGFMCVYNRGSHKGAWSQLFAAIADDPDLEYLMVDGSMVRVHQRGAAKKQQNGYKVFVLDTCAVLLYLKCKNKILRAF